MIQRPFWINKFNSSWETRPVTWLSGVRRSGKTTLSKMLPGSVYLNCDLPSVKRQLEDPEFFFRSQAKNATIIFDEIHRLIDPSTVLKIGADEFPQLKILATGSSTLSATKKFRDSLTGRKNQLFLPPVLWNESIENFNINDLDKRLLHGGLPEFLLAEEKDPSLYSEWIDSYYARDIQELFDIRNRTGFMKLLHLLFLQSGGTFEISSLAKESGLSRPTVMSHIEALSVAHAINQISPYFGGGKKEIVKRPKIYAFDTGFVTHVKGWDTIRESDRGLLWEHLVLDMLKVKFNEVFYWQDKNKNEIDFIVKGKSNQVYAFECKIKPDNFSVKALLQFREYYPEGKNYCICPHIKQAYKLRFDKHEIVFTHTVDW